MNDRLCLWVQMNTITIKRQSILTCFRIQPERSLKFVAQGRDASYCGAGLTGGRGGGGGGGGMKYI